MADKEVLEQSQVDELVKRFHEEITVKRSKIDIYKNVVDPFSALLEASLDDQSVEEWLQREKLRQAQKTLQNMVGTFQEKLASLLPTWEHREVGKMFDLISTQKQVIAEFKNKHNTVKGSDKKAIYDLLGVALAASYSGWTAYYVEFIPKNASRYNSPFQPSDNTASGERRAAREDIRIIDGYSFYALFSDPQQDDALDIVFEQVLHAVQKVARGQHHEEYRQLFRLAFHGSN